MDKDNLIIYHATCLDKPKAYAKLQGIMIPEDANFFYFLFEAILDWLYENEDMFSNRDRQPLHSIVIKALNEFIDRLIGK